MYSCTVMPWISTGLDCIPIEFDGFWQQSWTTFEPTCEKLHNVGGKWQITGSDNEIFSIIGHSPCEKPHFFTPNGL
jgi:hypothetical protein